MQAKRKLAAIMFTDMVGYTALMQKDEERAKLLRDRHRQVLRQEVSTHDGEILQYYGDGTLCIFNSAKEAVSGALKIQQQLRQDPEVPLRIGIHLGDIVHDAEGVYGDGVNVASRIESLSIPGGILISEMVQHEIKNHTSLQNICLGTFSLKNVKRPIEVFALTNEGLAVPSADEVKGKAVRVSRKGIAVLPLHNLSANPENEYFGEGISEEIINGLTKIDGISITCRSSTFALKDENLDAKTIGQRLGVSHVLEGSVRRAGNQVRVSVQLINTADGYQQWSEIYQRTLDNIFDVQDEIARAVVNRLRENFDLASKEKRIIPKSTENAEAYNLYLRGLHHWNRQNPEDLHKAIEIFEKVVTMDPDFAQGYCTLSHCYSFMGSCGAIAPVKAYAKAHEAVLISLEKNADQAESHLALAMIKFFHLWDWKGTRTSLGKASCLGLNSGLFNQVYALYLATVGELQEAKHRMRRAVHLDPLSRPLLVMLGNMHLFSGEYLQALQQYEQVLELDPSFRGAMQLKGVALLSLGRVDEALKALHRYHEMVNKPMKAVHGLVIAYSVKGDLDTATKYLARLEQRKRQDQASAVEVDLAFAYWGLHRHDDAIAALERVYEQRFSIVCLGVVFILRWPYFADIWKHPRFDLLRQKMGLPPKSSKGQAVHTSA